MFDYVEIKEENIVGLSNELKNYLLSVFGRKIKCSPNVVSNSIEVSSPECALYLRVGGTSVNWPKNTLVIARLGFKETRYGHGARLLRFFLETQGVHGCSYIGIESANEKAVAFGMKFGLACLPGYSDMLAASIEVVREHLLAHGVMHEEREVY
ncbi:hypothetical protein [Silvimonas amylolytica]|uniref:N-acetyltransferase domain-containing protein n=1 Tax=Silvimonas amylolytica TaxID=449663 RepID=A0ABQ2PMH6_9NEIS|nr:hypothetical protein [Silvimonas amylolytica]GGP26817.1 hypothetical protein GCM10010971_26360 [Silvimonas amylolytica]